jgi:hypothetical protein
MLLFLITSVVSLAIGSCSAASGRSDKASSGKQRLTRHAYRARLVIVRLHWPTA